MDIFEGLAMLSLFLKLLPVIPAIVTAAKAAAAELSSADPMQQKLLDVAEELESIGAAISTALK